MENTNLSVIKQLVETEMSNPENVNLLITTTFKGLEVSTMKRALLEGMMRGFTFKDFLEKNIYAIPFSGGYSLVTSVDHARKVGMRSGVVGKSAPTFEEKDGKIISCTITIKRQIHDYIGDFTATVYFEEYNTKRNLWITKPRTMIAKVAEMHALRMACPEELSQSYLEEEVQIDMTSKVEMDMDSYKEKLEATKDIEELKRVWSAIPIEAKTKLADVKEAIKAKFTPIDVEAKQTTIEVPKQ